MYRNNISSSEDFTESQGFENFMNAKDSDDEDKALGKSKNQAQSTGFYGSKTPAAAQANPSYSNASYTGGKGSGQKQTYGGYGGYSGYGGGYGDAGSGYGGSASKANDGYGGGAYGSGYGSGFGAGGGYGSGYGGGGSGTGYGGGTGYSGYDITGFGGTGYDDMGAGTGYKDNDDEDEEDEEEDEGFEIDLKSVMQRKEAQKTAKLAEEKKAEEEKAKQAKAASAAAQQSSLKTTPSKNPKNKTKNKVSFDFDSAIPDDSDNDNNKNISHISEKDSDRSSDSAKRKKISQNAYEDSTKINSSKKILSFVDNKDSESSHTSNSDNSSKRSEESVYDVKALKEDKSKTAMKLSLEKKEEKASDSEASYPPDFDESSSKFGSGDYGKQTNKVKGSEKKAEPAEDSSYLSESREPKPLGRDEKNVEGQKDESNKKIDDQRIEYIQASSSLAQDYETRIAKDYVYESLLKDERRRIVRLENQLTSGGEQIRTVQDLLQEKDVNIHRLESQNQSLKEELEAEKEQAQGISKANKIFEAENEDLQKRVDVLESKVLDLESQRKILERESEEKSKMLKEKRDFLEKNFETKAINEIKSQFESEKDLLLMRIEHLQEENKQQKEEMMKIKDDSRLYKTSFRQKAESDQDVKRLKQEIMLLELKLQDREQLRMKRKAEAQERDGEAPPVISGVPQLDKELQIQELLIRGFQKENEKLITENKTLKREIEELHGRLYDGSKKMTEIKAKLVHNTDSVLITDKEIDIETRKMLGSENLISKNDLKDAHITISQLQKDMLAKEETFKQREIELKYEVDRLRNQKMELEAKYSGVDLFSLKKDDENYRNLASKLDNEKKRHEAELKDLRSKLNWYIENQDTVVSKDEVIREKNEAIRKVEEEMMKVLSDPSSNLDAKSKYYNKVINEDKKRIKQLERDVDNLEEALKKRNPGVYDKLKNEKDENTILKDLRQTLKKVEEDKNMQEKDYENKLSELRQKFDKLKLGYESKAGEPSATKHTKPGNTTNGLDNMETLRARIKDLEKEVEDSKKYYLKKASELKGGKKDGKIGERVPKDVKGLTKKVQFDVNNELGSKDIEDKENIRSNNLVDNEKFILLGKLANLHMTPAYSILNGFQNYKANILEAFKQNKAPLVSSANREFSQTVDNTLWGFAQKDAILNSISKIEELISNRKTDPRTYLNSLQETIYEIVWSEMKHENSAMTTNLAKQPTMLNNFFDNQEGEVTNRKLLMLEENLKKKEEEMMGLQQKVSIIVGENARLTCDKSNLELIIQQLPKNPKSLDFATMEKKLEIIERNYRDNELELRNAFRKLYNIDPMGGKAEQDNNKVAIYEREIIQLKSTVDKKNKEIFLFRQEMEVILKELDKLRRFKM